MARRAGTDLVELTAPLGQIVPLEQVEAALKAHPDTKLVGVVHAETSTGVRYPVPELGPLVRAIAPDAMLMVDCVTSLGGEEVSPVAWGMDYAYSCSQKSLGCPPGLSPFTMSAARSSACTPARRRSRSLSTSTCSRSTGWSGPSRTTTRCRSCSTTRSTRASGSRSRRGCRARWARHEDAGRYFQQQMRDRGFTFLTDPDHQLWELTAVDVPEGVDGKEIQTRILREHHIEVGGGLGPTAPPIWRVGLMGVNANRETADRVARRVRRRPAPLGRHDRQGPAASQRARRPRARTCARWRRRPRSAPTSCSSTSRTRWRPTTRSGRART